MEPNFRRAWTTNDGSGFHFEARSYSSPAFTFEGDEPSFMQHDAGSSQPRPARPPSLFRTVAGAVGLFNEIRRVRAQQRMNESSAQDNVRPASNRQSSAGYYDSRDERPETRRRRPGYSNRERSDSYQTDGQPRADWREQTRQRQPSRSEELGHMIADVEEDIAEEQDIIENCATWLRHNRGRRNISRREVESTDERLERHKRKLKRAKESLRELRTEQEQLQQRSQARQQEHQESPRRRPAQRRASTQAAGGAEAANPDIEQLFNLLFGAAAASAPFMRQRAASADHPAFAHINMMNDFFASRANGPRFVFTSSSDPEFARVFGEDFFTGAGPGFTPRSTAVPPSFARPAQPQVPLRLLTTTEAKQIFEQYDQKWKALDPADSAVPYPCRGHVSSALLALDTIHAPLVTAPTSAWSKEDLVRANTQCLFLAVVGFTPVFTDRASRIELDFSSGSAGATQLQTLADMLKRERVRWHSDKLGRRNDGQAGPNVTLQQDEIARGVFHAVCELGDLVASKRA